MPILQKKAEEIDFKKGLIVHFKFQVMTLPAPHCHNLGP